MALKRYVRSAFPTTLPFIIVLEYPHLSSLMTFESNNNTTFVVLLVSYDLNFDTSRGQLKFQAQEMQKSFMCGSIHWTFN
jgi:hypothetical protein